VLLKTVPVATWAILLRVLLELLTIVVKLLLLLLLMLMLLLLQQLRWRCWR